MKEGSIDFDSVETKFQFDTQGKPIAIIKKVRLESNRLVEEFMLLANQVVAQHIGYAKKEEHQKPFLYRLIILSVVKNLFFSIRYILH